MKPVDQTSFGPPTAERDGGNCFSACVASLLELPVQEVPYFMGRPGEPEGSWVARLDAWLRPRGLFSLHFDYDPTRPDAYPLAGHYILCGKNPKGDDHAVVALGREAVFDPNPSRAGLASVDGFALLVPTFDGTARAAEARDPSEGPRIPGPADAVLVRERAVAKARREMAEAFASWRGWPALRRGEKFHFATHADGRLSKDAVREAADGFLQDLREAGWTASPPDEGRFYSTVSGWYLRLGLAVPDAPPPGRVPKGPYRQ